MADTRELRDEIAALRDEIAALQPQIDAARAEYRAAVRDNSPAKVELKEILDQLVEEEKALISGRNELLGKLPGVQPGRAVGCLRPGRMRVMCNTPVYMLSVCAPALCSHAAH